MRRYSVRAFLIVLGVLIAAVGVESAVSGQTSDVSSEWQEGGWAELPITPNVATSLPGFTLSLQTVVASGLNNPVHVTHAGDGSGRLFVAEKWGRLRIVSGGALVAAPFLTITSQVESSAAEQGLLSVAFDPNYRTNGEFYLYYTTSAPCCVGDVVISRFKVSNPAANTANVVSVTHILTIPQPANNHNGGQLQFGPDGFLYISSGDGGGAGDTWSPAGNGQDLSVLLGKVLRINPRGAITYTIPLTNPFRQTPGARPEIWAYGLRNPWRFSFDRLTGDLYIGDVGQSCWEEINFQPAGSSGGENYGWRLNEGRNGFNTANYGDCVQPPIAGTVLPIWVYGRNEGIAVTGGDVYRGAQHPALQGIYFFGDYVFGRIWALRREGSAWSAELKLQGATNLASFGEDEQGNLYVAQKNGTTTGSLKRLVMTLPAQLDRRVFAPMLRRP